MNKKLTSKSRKLMFSLVAVASFMAAATPVLAQTVHYKNTAVYWNHGRTAGLWGWSEVQSHVYTHSTTVNGEWSGWKKRGTLASVNKYIGKNTLEAYWDCK
ncbi:hypothetical protein [Lactobacillus sp.]|uniref:hypothetical protein n=1 Tax=Lactobacillus sp. TaxID=1591 RepID=UPI003F0F4214